jgi:TolB-like protein/Tfp pilus assembly protein PilF
MTFIEELKRRRVFRAGLVYVVAAWAVIQAADIILPRLGLPDWTVTFIIVTAGLGLPIALVLAWLYDINPDPARSDASRPVPRRAYAYLATGVLVGLVGFAAYASYERVPAARKVANDDVDPASIAVLPFVNMSADPEQEYFSDGLTEELLNALSQVQALRVAARTSSFSFKGKNLPVAEIARTLKVRTVLEGSVRKANNRVRITAQLINASDGYHLWSQTFDRELTDIFAIQEEISRSITDALKLRLAADDSASLRRAQHDLSAYDLYLRARFYWNKRTQTSLREALTLLEQAIQIDPGFARAHAALADVYGVWNDYATTTDRSYVAKSIAAANRALQLDSTLAEAYASLGNAYHQSLRFKESQAAFRRAIAMKPGYATTHQWYAWSLLHTGNAPAALNEIETARKLDPLSLIINENKGEHLLFSGRYDEAIVQFQHTLELDSTFTVTYPFLALSYSMLGDHTNALRWAERTLARSEYGVYDMGQAAYVLARAGKTERARAVLTEMEKRRFWAMMAPGYFALGDTARALAALEKDYELGGSAPLLEQLSANPALTPLRSHPRFQALRRKLGLSQSNQ